MLFACRLMFAVLVGKTDTDLSNTHCALSLGYGHPGCWLLGPKAGCNLIVLFVQPNYILVQWKTLSLIFQIVSPPTHTSSSALSKNKATLNISHTVKYLPSAGQSWLLLLPSRCPVKFVQSRKGDLGVVPVSSVQQADSEHRSPGSRAYGLHSNYGVLSE